MFVLPSDNVILSFPKCKVTLFAQAVKMIWIGKMNTTSARMSPAPERGEPVAVDTLDFEGEMVSAMLNKSDYPDGVDSFARAMRSFGDVASSTILGDLVRHRWSSREHAWWGIWLWTWVDLTLFLAIPLSARFWWVR